MSKHIPVDKLIAEIEKLQRAEYKSGGDFNEGRDAALEEVSLLIDSLQQEQPEVQNGKFVFPKYLYARTKDNKTIDMSYAPQDMTAVEYIRNDFVEQEQPEVDYNKFEKLFHDFCENNKGHHITSHDACMWFWELGLKARNEHESIL